MTRLHLRQSRAGGKPLWELLDHDRVIAASQEEAPLLARAQALLGGTLTRTRDDDRDILTRRVASRGATHDTRGGQAHGTNHEDPKL